MPDQPVTYPDPFRLRKELLESLFDGDRLGFMGQAETLSEACDVGINNDSGDDVEGVAQDDISGFASDAIESHQGFDGIGDNPVVKGDYLTATGLNVSGFIAIEADTSEIVFERSGVGLGIVGRGFIGLEEVSSDDVYLSIRALS